MRTRHKVIGAALAAVSIAAAVITVALVVGTQHTPPDMEMEPMRCNFNRPVDTTGPPASNSLDRISRRIKRFCDAMGATTRTAAAPDPVLRVNARRFCLEMATQSTPIPGVDCNTIPNQAVYYHH